jgi:hypothetical protein
MKIKTLFFILALTVISTGLSPSLAQSNEENVAGILVKVYSKYDSTFKTRYITVVIPDEAYSKENLIRIWRHYCEQYPDKKDKLDLRVFIKRSYEHNRQFSGWAVDMHTGEAISPNGVRVQLRECEASFVRMGKGALAKGGDNELMIYCPNPDKPRKTERIVLAGVDPFDTAK